MFLRSEFYIVKEDQEKLVFHERQSTLVFSCLIDLAIFLVFIICSGLAFHSDIGASIFMGGIGILALAHGAGPLLFQRKIVPGKQAYRPIMLRTGFCE